MMIGVPPEASYLLQRLSRPNKFKSYASARSFEADCADLITLWTNLPLAPGTEEGEDMQRKLVDMWSGFVKNALSYVMSGNPLLNYRPLLEAILASSAAVESSILTAASCSSAVSTNSECVESLTKAVVDVVAKRTAEITALIPPLDLLQQVLMFIDLLQEYYHLPGDKMKTTGNCTSLNPILLHPLILNVVKAYTKLVERCATLFVEEVAFPTYWNIGGAPSPACILVDGVHPTIYFCFTTMISLVRAYRNSGLAGDDRSCRQVIAQVWYHGSFAMIAAVETVENSEKRKRQLEIDTLHYVLFARMFREFVGEGYFAPVTRALVKLLVTVGGCVRGGAEKEEASVHVHSCTKFVDDIWNVCPIKELEWLQLGAAARVARRDANSDGSPNDGAFVPWSKAFVRAANVEVAREVPAGWESTCFNKLM
ncbi:hypothetical protein DPX39_040017200 [Trypanosoma brucei equiperdum]|uniref:Uncharacterized protein n=1 Tax=Trypanosoma brucei equiperdum TaxID=630700 RepID=A0A3L6L948_9TRYP|nr:hypothetical protein DPX39_040017200 [Trypanosoma brucei equiperdum]